MDEALEDRRLTELVRPVRLPPRVSDLWEERFLRPICRWLPHALATYQEWPERPGCGHFFALPFIPLSNLTNAYVGLVGKNRIDFASGYVP